MWTDRPCLAWTIPEPAGVLPLLVCVELPPVCITSAKCLHEYQGSRRFTALSGLARAHQKRGLYTSINIALSFIFVDAPTLCSQLIIEFPHKAQIGITRILNLLCPALDKRQSLLLYRRRCGLKAHSPSADCCYIYIYIYI